MFFWISIWTFGYLYNIQITAITAQNKNKMKKLKNFLVKNWKTSIAGVIVAIATYLKVSNVIDVNAFTLIGSLTTAIGLMLAKDSDKTGEK